MKRNYATKADIKNISNVDASNFALKTNWANWKTEVDKLDIDKLVPVPVDLTKLSDVVKNDVVKKADYNTKITEIENKIPYIINLATKTALTTIANKIPDNSSLVKKTDYNTEIAEIDGKISDISNLAKKNALTSVENKISNISGLATKTELTTVQNNIPDISNLATTNLINTVPDISTLIEKVTLIQKLKKLKASMLVTLDLTQN